MAHKQKQPHKVSLKRVPIRALAKLRNGFKQVMLKIFFIIFIIHYSLSAALHAEPGEVIERWHSPSFTPLAITYNPKIQRYYLTEFIGGKIYVLDSTLKTVIETFPVPFPNEDVVGGITYDSVNDSLWIVNSQSRQIMELHLDGTPTGKLLTPLFGPVETNIGGPLPTGLVFNPEGNNGEGTLFVVEANGTLIYEIQLNGVIINYFEHPDDEDGYPGKGRTAGSNDVKIIQNPQGELDGFIANGYDFFLREYFLRRFDKDGNYTGFWIPLAKVGGIPGGFLLEPNKENPELSTILCISQSSHEFVRIKWEEFPLPEITETHCVSTEDDQVQLTWNSFYDYDHIEVWRNSALLTTIAGDEISFIDTRPPADYLSYHLVGVKGSLRTETQPCGLTFGPGQIINQIEYPGTALADLTTDAEGKVYALDFLTQRFFVFSSELELIEETPLFAFPNPLDRLSGIAYRPETGNFLIFNSRNSTLVEVNFMGEPESEQEIPVILPTGIKDPDPTERSVIGMTYIPGPDGEDGHIWLLENQRNRIYKINLVGETLLSLDHPDLIDPETVGGFNLNTTNSGIAIVPGSNPPVVDLTGRDPLQKSSRAYIFRINLETLEYQRGKNIPLRDSITSCLSKDNQALATSLINDKFRLYTAGISFLDTCIFELNSSTPHLAKITGLTCQQIGFKNQARLSFRINDDYDRIEIFRNRQLIQVLPPNVEEYIDEEVEFGLNSYEVIAYRGEEESSPAHCQLRIGAGGIINRFRISTPPPDQIAYDSDDGSFYVSTQSQSAARSLFKLDAQFDLIEVIENIIPPGASISTMAIRPSSKNPSQIYLISSAPSPNPEIHRTFVFYSKNLTGKTIDTFDIAVPVPTNNFVPLPVGLTWDERNKSFYFLERNTGTIVEIEPNGKTVRQFKNPLKPERSFVFDNALSLSPSMGGYLLTSATPNDGMLTFVGHISEGGQRTGFTIPLDNGGPNNYNDIHEIGNRLYVASTINSLPTILELELFDNIDKPTQVVCHETDDQIQLTWENPQTYDSIVVYRNGEQIAELEGTTTQFVDSILPEDDVKIYALQPIVDDDRGPWAYWEQPDPPLTTEDQFIRGDADGSSVLDIGDPIVILTYLFLPGDPIDCYDAADTNDSGTIEIADTVLLLEKMFLGTGVIPPPNEVPGIDPTPDAMTCDLVGGN